MISIKFIFCKFRHALSPKQKATKQTNFYIFKKAKCYLDVLLDQLGAKFDPLLFLIKISC